MLHELSGPGSEREVLGSQRGGLSQVSGISLTLRPDRQTLSFQCPLGERNGSHFSPCQFPFRTFVIHFKLSGAFLDTMAVKKVLCQQEGPSLLYRLPK